MLPCPEEARAPGEQRTEDPLTTQPVKSEASAIAPLQAFAAGIRRDHDAVLSGLTLPYSSGKVEGTVCKIKMIKRRTYGRASFGLLRKLVLLA